MGADVVRSINKLVVIYRRLPTQDQTLLDSLRDLLLALQNVVSHEERASSQASHQKVITSWFTNQQADRSDD
jgi:allophanate hydrolase subunit 1